jgi:hypothetical protein
MSNNPLSIAPIASLFGRRLVAGLSLFRKKSPDKPAMESHNLWLNSALSNYHDAGPDDYGTAEEQEVCPQTEAEIYAIFGRLDEAAAVLDAAEKAGRLMAEDVINFWARLEAERGCTNPA